MRQVDLESIASNIDYGITESATKKNTGIKFLRITDISENKIDWDDVPFCTCSEKDQNKFLLQENDIVFARTGSVGNTCLILDLPAKVVFASYLIRIRPNLRMVNPQFLKYYFQTTSYWKQIEIESVGAIQGGLNASKLRKLQIPLPPLPEQQRIATILQKADRIRRLRRYARQLSDGYLQSVFLEMFGDPVSSKYPKIEIRRITESLDSCRIPVEASIRSTRKGIYPYYGASGVIDYIDDYLFNGVNLLIAEDGANLVARTTPIAFIASGKYWVNNHAHVLRTKNNVDIHFLSHILNSMKFDPYITGTAQPKLNAENLGRIEVLFPPIKEQILFSSIVKKINELSKKCNEAERQTEQLFQSLLHQAFEME